MKKFLISFYLLLAVLMILPCCAPYKMKAIRAQRDHRYDLSIKFASKHLNSHPNDRAAIQLLNRSARGYYDDLQKKIQHYEKIDQWDQVVQAAESGFRILSEVTKIVGTDFPAKEQLNYLLSKSEQSKFKQADELYADAIKYYDNGDYQEALNLFKQIESYVRHFKDSDKLSADINQKLAAQEYQKSRDLLNQGKLEQALTGFEKAAEYQPDFLDAAHQINQLKSRLAEQYLNEGQIRFNSGDYKNAYNTLKKSLRYQPEYSSAQKLFNETKEKLTVRLAVFPFSSSRLDEKFGAIVSQNLLTQALPAKSDFIEFLEREHLQKIFEEQALSQTGAIDENTAVQVGKISGVNTIVVGSVTLISHKKIGPTERTLTGHYDRRYRDPKGVQRTKKEPFNYKAYDIERSVEVSLSYRLISVETGSILFNESLTELVADKAEWITCQKEFVKHLSSSDQKKMKASQEPKSMESLINQAIDSITQQAASKIISQISPF